MDSDSDSEVEYEPENFQVGPYDITLTTIAFMPIAKLAKNQSNGVEISGQKLWCGSLVVLQYLMDHRFLIESKTVIELGAGTGLLGMICRKLNANKCYLTDHDDRSISHMIQDLNTNKITNCEVIKLDWFNAENFDYSIFNQNIDDNDHKKCDKSIVIVAGDVLYKSTLLHPFFNTVQRIFTSYSHSVLYLCHIPRAGNEHEHVIATIKTYNLQMAIIDELLWKKDIVLNLAPIEDYNRAKLYKITPI